MVLFSYNSVTRSRSGPQRPATREGETEKERERQSSKREREKDLGKKRACESLGATQASSQRTNRLLGPCDPKQTLAAKRSHTAGGLSPSAREAQYTWGALPQGAGETTCFLAPCGIECQGGRLGAWSRRTGKTTDQKKKQTPLPPRVQKKPQRSPERIQKARGAQNGTPKKPQNKKDARPKQANKTKRRGQKKKRKRKKNHNTCGGVCGVLLALSSISSKRKKEEEEKQQKTSSTQTLRQRERDKKTRPDINRILIKHFRGEIARKYIKTNHRQIHTKNTRTQKESENKSSLPKIYRANRP